MNGSAIRTVLKFGGLTFSGILTISLFVRLFGTGPYGLVMSFAALALFEIGAAGWASILEDAREGQRAIATVCLFITISLSLLSSMIEIIMATQLGANTLADIDLPFITLFAIAIALATNIVGAISFQFNAPDVSNKTHELERQARIKRAQNHQRDILTDLSLTRAEEKLESMAADIANRIAEGTADQVITQLLANFPNRKQLPPPPALEHRGLNFSISPNVKLPPPLFPTE